MELLEYQAKELFRQMGIPVLPSQRIEQPKDLKGLEIPYPVVLKSQVQTGGRGKAGGIKFVENTIDAIAVAQMIFHLPIMGKYPDVLLAEAKYDADREFYLAVVLDSSLHRPLLLGSQQGGIEIETTLGQMCQVIVDQEFSPFYARRLALRMGLTGELIQSVSAIVEKMYQLFLQYDLDLVEINPLAVSPSGELMALDGKVTVNDAALGRHHRLLELSHRIPNHPRRFMTSAYGVHFVPLDGNIGILCNGAGLTMTTLDLIHKAKGKPANLVDLGGEYRLNGLPTTLQERIDQGLDLILQNPNVKAVLVNILGSAMTCLQVAEAIAHYLKRQPPTQIPPLVVRLVGEQFQEAKDLLAPLEVAILDNLDEAIVQTVALSKAKPV